MSRLLHALKSLDSWAHEDPTDLAPLVAIRKGEPAAAVPTVGPPVIAPTANPLINGPIPPSAPLRAMPSVSETSDALPAVICSLTADRPVDRKPAVAETMMFTPSSEPAGIASPFAGYRLSPEAATPVKPLIARAEPIAKPAEQPATDPRLMTIAYEPSTPSELPAATPPAIAEAVPSAKPLPTFEEITAATPIDLVTPPPIPPAALDTPPAEAISPLISVVLPIITEPVATPPAPTGPEVSPLERFANHQLNQEATAARFTNLSARLRQDVPWSTGRTLLFTGVGKTTDAAELLLLLGITLAEGNETVLVIDANRTSARLTRELSANDLLPASRGKKTPASPQQTWLEDVRERATPGLYFLSLARTEVDFADVELVSLYWGELKQRFNTILLDGGTTLNPSLSLLSRLADATYLLIRLGSTDTREAQEHLALLRTAGARVMGCVATSENA